MAAVKYKQKYSPYDYEEGVAAYLRSQGYTHVKTTKMSGDYGADVTGVSPSGQKVCVQCKMYSSPVGVKAVQEVYSAKAYYGCSLAYVFTTSSFTPQAEELAARTGVELYVYTPESVPHRFRRRGNWGCLIWLLLPVLFVVLLTVFVQRSETKQREERAQQIVDSVSIDGIYYQLYPDHALVVGLADKSMQTVSIKENVEGVPVTEITERAFSEEEMSWVTIPDSVHSIGASAFSMCKSLRGVRLPSELESIPDSCFILCKQLSEVSIPAMVKEIGSGAFESTAITTADLSHVSTLERNAFSSCSNLTGVFLSSDLSILESRTFAYCTALRTIEVPEGVTEIGVECFLSCEALTAISLPDSLTDVGARCFQRCKSLPSITIPPHVKKLDSQVFSEDTQLMVITLPVSCKIPGGSNPFSSCNAILEYY